MPDTQAPDATTTASPTGGLRWRIAFAATPGLTAILLLVLTGALDGLAGFAGAATVAAITAGLALLTHRRTSAKAHAAPVVADGPGSEPLDPHKAALEMLPDPVLVITAREPDDLADRRILFANTAARQFLRLQRVGGPLVAAMRDPEVLEAVDEALFGGSSGAAIYEPVGARDRFWLAITRPLGSGAGGERVALAVFRDETEARRSEQARADFLANASHELRTPLASLSGFIETLRGHAKDDVDARDRFLGIMHAQAERMARLIDDLMSLSRIEQNEHIAPAGYVDLSLAATDVIDALSPLVQGRGLRIDLLLAPRGEATVEGDRDQIIQVVQNLIENAVKYTPPGGVVAVEAFSVRSGEIVMAEPQRAARLGLLTPDHVPGKRYLGLRVTDQGRGIAREHLPRLTERFYRVEGQKSGDKAGTGLGLAIVKHIMNRHRGGLAVESTVGAGSVFSIWFPEAARSSEPVDQAGAVAKLS